MDQNSPQDWVISITAFNIENGEELIDKALSEIKEIILNLKGEIKERK